MRYQCEDCRKICGLKEIDITDMGEMHGAPYIRTDRTTVSDCCSADFRILKAELYAHGLRIPHE